MKENNTGRKLVIISGFCLIIGAILPWGILESFIGTLTINGTQGDGVITLIIGTLLLIYSLIKKGNSGERYSYLASISSLICALIIFPKFFNFPLVSNSAAIVSIGIGLYLSAIGTIIGIIGGLFKMSEEKKIPEMAIEEKRNKPSIFDN